MKKLKNKIFEILFEADTPLGKVTDLSILCVICLSVLIVILESVPGLRSEHRELFITLEWIFTSFFTIEYLLRVWVVRHKFRYIFSFYGIIDLLAILPVFATIFFASAHSLLIIRVVRLLRVFRVFKVSRYISASNVLAKALSASRAKIGVFLFAVVIIVLMMGTMMYLIEGEANGFTSIPKSIYWAIVTLTTVGYGDITPHTTVGQIVSSGLMILGYAIIAVPTGIISVELSKAEKPTTQVCPSCLKEGHETDALHCKFCGTQLNE